MSVPALRRRASGVLLHPTSLPGPHGSGDLGTGSARFVEWLASAGQSWWQMLPVGPPGYGDSPYSADSTFAGSPLLVSLEGLADDGLLDAEALRADTMPSTERVDFGAMHAHRERWLRAAFEAFRSRAPAHVRRAHEAFCDREAFWLRDFGLFRAIKRAHGGLPWTRWAPELRRRDPTALKAASETHADVVAFERFAQFAFDEQWRRLHALAAEHGVALMGDLPIFVAHDSADVWQSPGSFKLDEAGEPTVVAGCPPDYFSATGQRWGNPHYDWEQMRATGYRWWLDRLRAAAARFDVVRLDHFIGFHRVWEIPATEPTAVRGRWTPTPGADLLLAVQAQVGALPFVAEDLGETTPEVYALRDRFDLPGLAILQFAFGDDPAAPSFLPHNFGRRRVVYTGTHDNDTTVGWFRDEGGGDTTRTHEQVVRERATALRYLGTDGREIHWDMIRLALASVADLAVVPAQDVLGLGSEARMNRPGQATGNWSWRLLEGALSPAVAGRLAELTHTYGRAPEGRRSA